MYKYIFFYKNEERRVSLFICIYIYKRFLWKKLIISFTKFARNANRVLEQTFNRKTNPRLHVVAIEQSTCCECPGPPKKLFKKLKSKSQILKINKRLNGSLSYPKQPHVKRVWALPSFYKPSVIMPKKILDGWTTTRPTL